MATTVRLPLRSLTTALLLVASGACTPAPTPTPGRPAPTDAPGEGQPLPPSAPGTAASSETARPPDPGTTPARPPPAYAGPGRHPSAEATPLDPEFLPFEDGCSVDADCATSETGIQGRLACCDSCASVGGTPATIQRVDAVCRARRAKNKVGPCPPRDCGPLQAVCRDGHCVTY